VADTNEMVITAFVEGRAARTTTLRSVGHTLYSYDYALAWHSHDGSFIVENTEYTGTTLGTYDGRRSYDAAFSPTTNRHRRTLHIACSCAGIPIVAIDAE